MFVRKLFDPNLVRSYPVEGTLEDQRLYGDYSMYCHKMVYEDHAMMVHFKVAPPIGLNANKESAMTQNTISMNKREFFKSVAGASVRLDWLR